MAGLKRDREGNSRGDSVADTACGPFVDMFTRFRDELDEHYDRKERIVKASRDVTAHAKKIIFALQRVKKLNSEFGAATQRDVDAHMASIATLLAAIAPDLTPLNRHRYAWQLRCLEELVEALSFAHYLRYQRLMTPAQVQAALPGTGGAAVTLTPHDYVFGVFDLFGEVMRFATAQRGKVLPVRDGDANVRDGDANVRGGDAKARDGDANSKDGDAIMRDADANVRDAQVQMDRPVLRDMQELACAFEMLPHQQGNKDFTSKMEVMRQSVCKVEMIGYGLVVRGSERPTGWVPDEAPPPPRPTSPV